MDEQTIQKQVAISAANHGIVSFRNNCGQAWTGKLSDFNRATRVCVIQNARPIRFGLIKGSPDRIGWKSLLITNDMIGKRLAVFCGIEVKTELGKLSDEQINFLEQVTEAGGIAIVARSPDDLGRELFKWISTIMK